MIYSLYIFDRHCAAVYYQDWHRSPLKPARPSPNVLPCVSAAVSPGPPAQQNRFNQARQPNSRGDLPLKATTGVIVGGEEKPNVLGAGWGTDRIKHEPIPSPSVTGGPLPSLLFDEEAKLVYGLVFSLRNLVRKLAGRDEPLHFYTTSTYSLHLFTTPTNQTFVLLSSPMEESLQPILRDLWRSAWTDFVVRNPLVSIDSTKSGRGIDNEMFRRSVDNTIKSLPIFK
ncbi:hypothetical protein CROQUDRAFT_94704 [Cronartium quercuum f. sp. fusiforme G11]|uniref:Trafficking protein particle complex subunit n=1 Tax=Cronartium quercuum f. sp. fusiforme G11 TaxID=708437 RepID=A0A9P6NEW5_9BASI|nr:hypothetical protein CROQUDRAFT_94704 [Cronartium quercuum f. sp. fusiforme G11]